MHSHPPGRAMTAYQRALGFVALPFLALLESRLSPVVGVLGYVVWIACAMLMPKAIALVAIVVPLLALLVSMFASVLLLVDVRLERE